MNTGPGTKFLTGLGALAAELLAGSITSFALKFDLAVSLPPPGPAPGGTSFTLASYPGYSEQVPSLGPAGQLGEVNVFDRVYIKAATVTFTGPTSGSPVSVAGYVCQTYLSGTFLVPAYYIRFPVPLLLSDVGSTIVIATPYFTLTGEPFDDGVTYTP